MYRPNLFKFSLFVAFSTLVLILAGGLVTSTGSGLSVPDWPLSYGQFFPPMIGGILFEHSHRLIAGSVGILTLFLSIWLTMVTQESSIMKWLALSAVCAIILQGVLGGLTVIYLLPKPISIAHACLGQTFFCLICAICLLLSKQWLSSKPVMCKNSTPFTNLCWTTFVFAYIQLILGAVVRHTHGLMLVVHIFMAFMVLIHVIFLAVKLFKDKAIQSHFTGQVFLINSLVLVQFCLGLGAYFFKYVPIERGLVPSNSEVLFATAHQTAGALILANLLILSLRARKHLIPDPDNPATSEYMDLIKPKVTLTALWTTFCGFILSTSQPINISTLLHILLGAFLTGAGGNALNQFYESAIDSKMTRTANRPIPSNKISPRSAFWFGWSLALIGIFEIFIFVSGVSGVIAALIFISYVFIYTPLKKRTPLNTYVGAIPGALPVLLGWSGGGGEANLKALSLFIILFIWQLPHFYAIAWLHKEDYRIGGLKMLSLKDASGRKTATQTFLFSIILFISSLTPYITGLAGIGYLISSLSIGILFIIYSFNLFKTNMQNSRKFISFSVIYLLILFSSLVLDKQ